MILSKLKSVLCYNSKYLVKGDKLMLKTYKPKLVLLSIFIFWAFTVQASQKGWQRQEVDEGVSTA